MKLPLFILLSTLPALGFSQKIIAKPITCNQKEPTVKLSKSHFVCKFSTASKRPAIVNSSGIPVEMTTTIRCQCKKGYKNEAVYDASEYLGPYEITRKNSREIKYSAAYDNLTFQKKPIYLQTQCVCQKLPSSG